MNLPTQKPVVEHRLTCAKCGSYVVMSDGALQCMDCANRGQQLS